MSDKLATKDDLKEMYNRIYPYLGGLTTSKAGFTPIGTIISVMGTTAPVNYLACDGTVYNIADYVELANYFNEQFGSKNYFGGDGTTTFAVPDLRGEFLRGTGTNSHANQGSGASVGVHQDATEHLCIYKYANNNMYIGGKDEYVAPTNVDTSTQATSGRTDFSTTAGVTNDPKTYTSRPTNTSVLYCIATKNFYIDPTLDYSTDEKIVGTWITGAPIWQKTVVYDKTTNDTQFLIPHNISNIGMVVRCEAGYWDTTNNIYRSLPANWIKPDGTQGTAINSLLVNTTNIIFRTYTGETDGNGKILVTIQYTKTTD